MYYFNPATTLLGIYPEKTIIRKDTCTPVFLAALAIHWLLAIQNSVAIHNIHNSQSTEATYLSIDRGMDKDVVRISMQ